VKLSSIKRRRPRIVMGYAHPFNGWTVEQYRSGMSTRCFRTTDTIVRRNADIDARRDARIKASKARAAAAKGR